METAPQVIYGINAIIEALSGQLAKVQSLFVLQTLSEKMLQRIKILASSHNVPVFYEMRHQLEQRCGSPNHQGVVAILSTPPMMEFKELLQPGASDLLVIADGVQDPQNLGALMRTIEFFGGKALLIPKHGACNLSAAAIKASAGASFHLPLLTVTNLNQAIESLKKAGYWCYGAVAENGISLFEVKFLRPAVIVVGNESKGIRSLVRKNCDVLLSIPRFGKVQSLNVANATSVVLIEWRRQHAVSS